MFTTSNEGLLNNYAAEPNMYYAEFPSEWQQRQYLWQGAIASLVIGLTLLTAIAVS